MPLKDHLNKLEYFCGVVEAKSILKASFQIGVTQPQLSRVVKQLEEDLECALVVRSSSGVEPTKEGIDLYNTAKDLLQTIGSLEKKIKTGSTDLKGSVRVGTYDSIGRYFFPSFLKFLKSTAPKLDILLETGRSRNIFEKLKKGEIEVAVCVNSEHLKARDIHKEIIYEDSFGFYHNPSVSQDFLDQVIIFPEAIGLIPGQEDKFVKTNKFRSRLLSDNLETVKSLSEESVGVGFLPHRVAREAVLQGKLIPLTRRSVSQNLFPHEIVLCKNRVAESGPIATIVSELTRFLSSWAKN